MTTLAQKLAASKSATAGEAATPSATVGAGESAAGAAMRLADTAKRAAAVPSPATGEAVGNASDAINAALAGASLEIDESVDALDDALAHRQMQDSLELEDALALATAESLEKAMMDQLDYTEPNPNYQQEVVVTVGNLLDMHRMLSYCLRGNQRPAVLRVQQCLTRLLPAGTIITYREPTE